MGLRIQRILCPVDFSQAAEHALAHAGELAQTLRARLFVFHAVFEPLDVAGFHVPHIPMERFHGELQDAARTELRGLCRRILPRDVDYEVHTQVGRPFQAIIAFAREHAVDLIVLGTTGLDGVEHWVIGTTAAKVIRKASCPVLTIRPPEGA